MDCAAHAGTIAARSCRGCATPRCDACLIYEVEGEPLCATCGARHVDRSQALGSALIGFVGVGYLAALAVAFAVFRARPVVGGLAAIVSMAVARGLQRFLRPPHLTRVDAAAPREDR